MITNKLKQKAMDITRKYNSKIYTDEYRDIIKVKIKERLPEYQRIENAEIIKFLKSNKKKLFSFLREHGVDVSYTIKKYFRNNTNKFLKSIDDNYLLQFLPNPREAEFNSDSIYHNQMLGQIKNELKEKREIYINEMIELCINFMEENGFYLVGNKLKSKISESTYLVFEDSNDNRLEVRISDHVDRHKYDNKHTDIKNRITLLMKDNPMFNLTSLNNFINKRFDL